MRASQIKFPNRSRRTQQMKLKLWLKRKVYPQHTRHALAASESEDRKEPGGRGEWRVSWKMKCEDNSKLFFSFSWRKSTGRDDDCPIGRLLLLCNCSIETRRKLHACGGFNNNFSRYGITFNFRMRFALFCFVFEECLRKISEVMFWISSRSS